MTCDPSAPATCFCRRLAAFGVESPGPGLPGVSNREVHQVCGEMGFTHYENLANLHQLAGAGRFQFIAFPLKIRGGTGAPVRAVALVAVRGGTSVAPGQLAAMSPLGYVVSVCRYVAKSNYRCDLRHENTVPVALKSAVAVAIDPN